MLMLVLLLVGGCGGLQGVAWIERVDEVWAAGEADLGLGVKGLDERGG